MAISTRNSATAMIALALAIGAGREATAGIVLDQQNVTDGTMAGTISLPDGSFRRAETFTVGVAGTLDHVEVQATGATTLNILSTANGVPVENVLASSIGPTTTADGFLSFGLASSGLALGVGEILAIELVGFGGWDENSPNTYLGGQDYFLNTFAGADTYMLGTAGGGDPASDGFREYVDVPSVAVPEPSSLSLCGIATAIALAVAKARRRRPVA